MNSKMRLLAKALLEELLSEPEQKSEEPVKEVTRSWGKKFDEDLQVVWGEVLVPNRVDSQGDYVTPEVIARAAYRFMLKQSTQKVDVNHDRDDSNPVGVVESFIAREDDTLFIPGSWVVGVFVGDEVLWEQVKKGDLNGFSMDGPVFRSKKEVLLNIDPFVSGTTSAHSGHAHEYTVKFDEYGNLLGGHTSNDEGHMHLIVKGTVTEAGGKHGHTHRFSIPDSLASVTEEEENPSEQIG